jgi:nucleotide-binding universal stress UspA family protein
VYHTRIYNKFRQITNFIKESIPKRGKKNLGGCKKICAQNGIVFNEKIIYGNQSWEITEFAAYRKFDLIVIGSRGMSRVKEAFLGSVANMVAHKSKISVLIVK